MDFVKLRSKVRAIILSFTGFIVFLIILRFFFDLLLVNKNNFFIGFIYTVTDLLISPFKGLILINLQIAGGSVVNFDALFSIVFYVVIGIAASEVITAFLYEKFQDVVVNFIDGIFKFIEFFILLRIILNLFRYTSAQAVPGIMASIINLTNWTSGILPDIPVPGLGFIDLSALCILVVIIIIDVFSEKILYYIFESVEKKEKPSAASQINETTRESKTVIQSRPPIQNIYINLTNPNSETKQQKSTKLVPVVLPINTINRGENVRKRNFSFQPKKHSE